MVDEKGRLRFVFLTCTGLVGRMQGWISEKGDQKVAVIYQYGCQQL